MFIPNRVVVITPVVYIVWALLAPDLTSQLCFVDFDFFTGIFCYVCENVIVTEESLQ